METDNVNSEILTARNGKLDENMKLVPQSVNKKDLGFLLFCIALTVLFTYLSVTAGTPEFPVAPF